MTMSARGRSDRKPDLVEAGSRVKPLQKFSTLFELSARASRISTLRRDVTLRYKSGTDGYLLADHRAEVRWEFHDKLRSNKNCSDFSRLCRHAFAPLHVFRH